MKISYYHYYFKERRRRGAPRVCHDIRPMLKRYVAHGDADWKATFKNEDDESVLMTDTNGPHTFMLAATREQEIIKAINRENISCADINDRLQENETAGFAGYFRISDHTMAMASTTRGPRTAAFSYFVNELVSRLGAGNWQLHVQPIGTTLTVEQARALAFVSRTSVKVKPGNPLYLRLKRLFAEDTDDVASFEIVARGKKHGNLKDVFAAMSEKATDAGAVSGLDKMTVRAKAALDDDLLDYYVETEGRLSEEIDTGSENHIIHTLGSRFTSNQHVSALVEQMMENEYYEQLDVPALRLLGDSDHWSGHLRPGNA